uniref:Uncharacterized protein n=1 Tax=Avena sativa TaxID=4498 RepID=A0ACD5T7S9_AVESA
MVAEARAAELDTLYSLYFPDAGRVAAAAVVGCVCLDHLTCTECARIGAAGDGTSAEGFEAAISVMADPVQAEGFEAAISGMATRLGLAASVGKRAKEVFRKMEEARAWPHQRPGWAKDQSKGALYAACLSIACRNEGSPRSLRELALATSARKEEIVRMTALIRRWLGEEEAGQATGVGVLTVSSFMRRFSAQVGLGEAESTAALEAARRLEEGVLDVRHNAEFLAAAVICLTLERVGTRKPGVKDVAAAIGLRMETIYRVCRNLRPHADLLFR